MPVLPGTTGDGIPEGASSPVCQQQQSSWSDSGGSPSPSTSEAGASFTDGSSAAGLGPGTAQGDAHREGVRCQRVWRLAGVRRTATSGGRAASFCRHVGAQRAPTRRLPSWQRPYFKPNKGTVKVHRLGGGQDLNEEERILLNI